MKTPMIGAGLLPSASDVQNVMEDGLANLLDGGFASGDGARVDVDQIGPSVGERGSRRDFDYGSHR